MVELDCLNIINDSIKEYLTYFDMTNTLHAFMKEVKGKMLSK